MHPSMYQIMLIKRVAPGQWSTDFILDKEAKQDRKQRYASFVYLRMIFTVLDLNVSLKILVQLQTISNSHTFRYHYEVVNSP